MSASDGHGERMMRVEQKSIYKRQDVDGLRGLLIAMCISGGLWAGMFGLVGTLLQ